MTDSRERKLEDLKDSLNENTGSKALFRAGTYAIRMRGGSTAVPTGRVAKLLEAAEDQGSLTGKEIAEILDTDEIGVGFETSWSVNGE